MRRCAAAMGNAMVAAGVICIGFVALAHLDRALAFQTPDQSLWSERAKAAYAAAVGGSPPVAELVIERLGLRAPVYLGTDRVTLNRGAGVIAGTALPGERGNVAISAHRDGFFRPLKDVVVGDVIELRAAEGHVQRFEVAAISIVDPLDVSVLEPTDAPVLTLVTCYPFYYVGFAPDRFIVRATALGE